MVYEKRICNGVNLESKQSTFVQQLGLYPFSFIEKWFSFTHLNLTPLRLRLAVNRWIHTDCEVNLPPSSQLISIFLNATASCLTDDTGCPSSQSVSPVKTPPDAGNIPVGFCPGNDADFIRKKCTIGMASEGGLQSTRHKKESKSGLIKPGE